jgi:hypothetical protein
MNTAVTVPEAPSREWYSAVSEARKAPIRCPFATVEACPRYYQSLSLLGDAGSTKIPEKEDERLLKRWRSHDVWPKTAEQSTSVMGEPGNPVLLSNFCPETTVERFGFFVTSLTRYADELDTGQAQKRLGQLKVPAGHPLWTWESFRGQHFTDCPLYAVLAHRGAALAKTPEPWWREHAAKIVVAIVVALATAVIAKVLA